MSNYDNSRVVLEDGATLHFRDEGSGAVLLFLHGMNSHSGTWRKNVPHFSRERRVLAPSLPPVFKLAGGAPVEEYVKEVRQLLLGLELSTVSIIGNSLGGWIAARLAITQPGLVAALVLEDTAGVNEDGALPNGLDDSGIPVSIIWGERDDVISVDAGRRLHSSVPRSELTVLRGVGHVPHWERASAFNALVEDFLRRRSL